MLGELLPLNKLKMERDLNKKEYELLKYLLDSVKNNKFIIDNLKVIDMEDGGMGSLYIVSLENRESRIMEKSIVEKQFYDVDGVPISVSVNIDTNEELFELDIWKADFNPVINYPKPDSTVSNGAD